MRTLLRDVIRLRLFLFAFVLAPSLLISQQTQTAPAIPLPEDNLAPADFTTILKEAWSYLKDQTDSYTKAVGEKTEFETTAEFEKRSIEARRQYLTKVEKYIKDKKYDQRVMGVLLKASLDHYDADNQIYNVSCNSVIEAPYNLPSISTEVPANQYVALGDSIKKGYRTSSIYLKFFPYFRWQVARDIAKAAKNDEGSIYFKVRFKVDMNQGEARKGARFAVVPKQILLFNDRTKTVYWEQTIR
jgi:hypothetical protein